jgi:glycosyltransferase involved in cell wall biosynthesis
LSKDRTYDVLIIGELVCSDLVLAEHLTRRGLRCCVLRRYLPDEKSETTEITTLSAYHTHFHERDILYYRNALDFLRVARKSRLIVSFTLSLVRALRTAWLGRHFLGLPPVVNITTGSDIAELALEKSLRAMLYHQYLRFVDLNWCLSYPYTLKNILALKVPNVVFISFPYYLVGDKAPEKVKRETGPLRFFHPSHLDWKVNDPGAHRTSSKGNDRFIRAFARALQEGMDAECLILERGPDKDEARALIHSLGVEDRFVWKPHLTRDELIAELHQADVVVDQFDVGGYGGISVEAMSIGKPVLVYVQENCMRLVHMELPPVLNCYTEEEIYRQIMACRDRAFLQDIGKRAKEWVYKYHGWDMYLDRFLFYYTLLTGHQVVDYGWERTPYSAQETAP